MERQKLYPLNPGEAKVLKATIYDLSELALKQTLYGIVQILSINPHLNRKHFEEILEDARKLTEITKQHGPQKERIGKP